MFAVYGISGPIFQGTLEQLNLLPPVRRRRPVDAARRIDDPATGEAQRRSPPDTVNDGNNVRSAAEHAVAEYRSMLPRELDRGPLYHADQIMQTGVISVAADDPVTRAWRVLVEHGIRQAPVLDANGQLVGIVSERNLLTSFNLDADRVRDTLARRVADVMSTPVVAAGPLTDIRRVARVMLERDVDGVPVVTDSALLVGFISRGDILRAVVTDPPLSVWR